MNLTEITVSVFAGSAALSALGVLLSRNIFYCALLLITCLLALAGIYLLLQAELLAATQVMVYAGGVIVLIIFGIMLTVRSSGKSAPSAFRQVRAGTTVTVVLFSLLIYALRESPMLTDTFPQQTPPLSSLGQSLFTEYAAPFELAGLLLLICLIAAVVIASPLSQKNHD